MSEKMMGLKVVGNGATKVVVAHGWIAGCEMYADFLPHIDQDAWSFAFLDSRGYGERIGEKGAMTMAQVAADVIAAADSFGWKEFHVLGHSMGGMAAQRVMVDARDRIISAILVAAVPASGAKITEERRSLLLSATSDPTARRSLIDANTGHVLNSDWIDALLDVSLRTTAAEPLREYVRSWTQDGFEEEVRGLQTPVLVLGGDRDPGFSLAAQQSTTLEWYPNSTAQLILDVGHYPMTEDAATFAALIREHFEQHA